MNDMPKFADRSFLCGRAALYCLAKVTEQGSFTTCSNDHTHRLASAERMRAGIIDSRNKPMFNFRAWIPD